MGKSPKKSKETKKTRKAPTVEKKSSPRREGKSVNKGIIRIAGKDVPGEKTFKMALMRVKGINNNLAMILSKYISSKLKFDAKTPVGDLPEKTVDDISTMLFDLGKESLPKWLLNRRKDSVTGKDVHVIMNDLGYYLREDIEGEKKLYTWKGYRHAYGQKVRGQRTRNTGRRGMTVGVIRKSQQPATKKAGGSSGSRGGKK